MTPARPLIALTALAALALAGCNKPADDTATPAVDTTAPAGTDTTTPAADMPPATAPVDTTMPADTTAPATPADAAAPAADGAATGSTAGLSQEQQVAAGKVTYAKVCAVCHQAEGQGVPGAFPPLAKSDYIAKDPMVVPRVIIKGLTGPITVNGTAYNSVMPPQAQLSDEDIANVSTYVLNSWGNPGGHVSPADVAKLR